MRITNKSSEKKDGKSSETLLKLVKKASYVFICGNGGSASNAEHFASDLLAKGVKAVCLNSNTSVLTMLANDFGYKHVFSKQLEVYGSPKDLLITISCSGTSKNIVNAIRSAKRIGMTTYQFETFKKGNRDFETLEEEHLVRAHEIKKSLK